IGEFIRAGGVGHANHDELRGRGDAGHGDDNLAGVQRLRSGHRGGEGGGDHGRSRFGQSVYISTPF
ncbi:MAG: hypothetical protein VX784_13255, partial [Pseudomonadota bacterium]|nr:hypothetical protein [Pseudomonadota bacterium]